MDDPDRQAQKPLHRHDVLPAFKVRRQTRGDLDPVTIGQVVFHSLNQLFIEFVKDDAMAIPDLLRVSEAQTRSLAMLMRPLG